MRYQYGGYEPEELEIWAVSPSGLTLYPDPCIPHALYVSQPIPLEQTRLLKQEPTR